MMMNGCFRSHVCLEIDTFETRILVVCDPQFSGSILSGC